MKGMVCWFPGGDRRCDGRARRGPAGSGAPCRPQAGEGADRNVFTALKEGYEAAETRRATTYYVMGDDDRMDPYRRKWIAEEIAGRSPADS